MGWFCLLCLVVTRRCSLREGFFLRISCLEHLRFEILFDNTALKNEVCFENIFQEVGKKLYCFS